MSNQLKKVSTFSLRPYRFISLVVCLILSALCPSFDSAALDYKKPQFKGRVQEIISDSSTWAKGAHVFREISRYDESGRVRELGFYFLKVTDDGLQKVDDERMGKWFYDEQGRHIKTTYALPDGSMDMVITHSYDDRGNKIDHTSFDKDGNITLRFVFSYD